MSNNYNVKSKIDYLTMSIRDYMKLAGEGVIPLFLFDSVKKYREIKDREVYVLDFIGIDFNKLDFGTLDYEMIESGISSLKNSFIKNDIFISMPISDEEREELLLHIAIKENSAKKQENSELDLKKYRKIVIEIIYSGLDLNLINYLALKNKDVLSEIIDYVRENCGDRVDIKNIHGLINKKLRELGISLKDLRKYENEEYKNYLLYIKKNSLKIDQKRKNSRR